MSGHARFGFGAFLLVAGFTTPAAANVITDFFSPSPAPEATAAAPAVAPEECLRQPGPAAAGQHWVYRYDGHRKCWFQAAEDSALAKKPVRRRLARRPVAASEEDVPAPRGQKDVEDARAELVSSAPAETPEPASAAPKLTVVHTVPVRMADAAALVPPAPVLNKPGADQLAPDQPAPRQADVESLLAEAPAASGEVATAPPATPIAAPGAKTGGGAERIASWLGALLMALGGAALLTSSRALRRALWPVRFPNSRTEFPVVAYDVRNDPSFGQGIPSAGARRDGLSGSDRQRGAALVHPARTRRPVAPALPSPEALWDDGIAALAALASPASPEAFPGRRATAYRAAEQRGHSSGS
jgi:hypothetical protein